MNAPIHYSHSNCYYDSIKSFKKATINSNNLSFLQLNIQGLNKPKKFDELKNMLSSLKCKIDVIIIGESKLKKSFAHGIYNLIGYNKFVCCRDSVSSGGGLIVYVKKGLLIVNVDKFSDGFERISINMKINNKGYKLIAYYRAPSQTNWKIFIKDIENEIKSTNDRIIVAGDINVDPNEKNNSSNMYCHLLDTFNIKVMNDKMTRNISGKVIDHFACNFHEESAIQNHTVHNSLSDHNLIISVIEDTKIHNVSKFKCLKRVDYNKAAKQLSTSIDFNSILMIDDPNIIADSLVRNTKKNHH